MKLAATIARSLQADMQAELRDIEHGVATGTREAGRGLRTELRRQVTRAGLGQRLARAWQNKHYSNQKLDTASRSRRSAASELILKHVFPSASAWSWPLVQILLSIGSSREAGRRCRMGARRARLESALRVT